MTALATGSRLAPTAGSPSPWTLGGSSTSDARRHQAPRVFMIISSFHPVVGGAERVTEAVCRGLAQDGMDVTVMTRRYPGSSPVDGSKPFTVLRLGVQGRGKLAALSFGVACILRLLRESRDEVVVHVHNPDTPLLVGLILKFILGFRVAATMHSDPQIVLKTHRGAASLRYRLAKRLDLIAVQHRHMKRQLTADGFRPERVRLLANAVDTEKFVPPAERQREQARARLGVRSGTLYLYLGRLAAVKRLDVLIEAWSLFEDSGNELMLVGDGEEENRIREQIARLGLHNVRMVPRTDDVPSFFQAADVFILPSEREGLSIALLEAMACGLAVIVSDLPGNRAVVQDGRNGFLFPVGDSARLAELLRAVEDRELRKRLGESAARKVQRRHSMHALTRRHRAFYARLLPESQRDDD
jgi:glycosyltransferase involved in cell wall biosynthesis